MNRERLEAYNKKDLAEMARKKGVAGWHGMRKEELVEALADKPIRGKAKKPAAPPPSRSRSRAPVQRSAARDTSGTSSLEETVESSKYNVGVPTLNLSSKTPKDLPQGYGKDRIVVMVRDPYWLHCYW